MSEDKNSFDALLSANAEGAPTPQTAGFSAASIERWLLARLLPTLGCVLFPAGLTTLRSIAASAGLACVLGWSAAFATILFLVRTRSLHQRARGHYAGSAFASCWIAASAIPIDALRVLASVTVAIGAIGLLWSRTVHARAGWLWLGFLLFPLDSVSGDQAYEGVTLLATAFTFAVFYDLRSRSLASFAVILIVGQGLVYASERGTSIVGWISVLFAVSSAVAAQRRLRSEPVSELRVFVGECVVAASLGTVISLFDIGWVFTRPVWSWVALVIGFELLSALFDRTLLAYRLGAMCATVTFATVWMSLEWPWHTPLFAVLLSAALLCIHAELTGDRLAAQLARANIWVAIAGVCAIAGRGTASPSLFLLGLAASQGLLHSVDRPMTTTSLPVWHGFVERRHFVMLRGYTIRGWRLLLQIKAIATLFSWLAVPLMWLRYLRSRLFPPDFSYVSYTTAHALGVWMCTSAAIDLLAAYPVFGSLDPHATLGPLLGCGYAVVVGRLAARHELQFGRVIGAGCAAFPALRAMLGDAPIADYPLAILLLVTGAAFAIIAVKPDRRERALPVVSS